MAIIDSPIEYFTLVYEFLVRHAVFFKVVAAIITIIGGSYGIYRKLRKPIAPDPPMPAEFAKVFSEKSEEFGIAKQTLWTFFNRFGYEKEPPEKWEEILERIAKDYNRFKKDASLLHPSDPEIKKLIQRATELAGKGSLDQARENLQKVRKRELAAAKGLAEKSRERFASAAKATALEARFLSTAGQYGDAALLFKDAAKLVKASDVQAWLDYLDNAAVAYYRLGDMKGDNPALRQAIVLFQTLLKERLREQAPLDWAMTQNNLGNALSVLGEREGNTAKLEHAVKAYRFALLEYTQQRVPLDWAMTQNNLGNALQALGECEGNTAKLEQAVEAYRFALEERTQQRVPLKWAMTQNNLGTALRALGERESDTAKLEQAVKAYRSALLEHTRQRVPLKWATTQNNLGNALSVLGEREGNTAKLEQAVVAYRSALLERTQQRVPLEWAMTQSNLGNALWALGGREGNTAKLEQAVKAYRSALKVFQEAGAGYYIDVAEENLLIAQKALARHKGAR